MTRRFEPLASSCDHDAIFALTYLRVTEEYRRTVESPTFFDDTPVREPRGRHLRGLLLRRLRRLEGRADGRGRAGVASRVRRGARSSCLGERQPAPRNQRARPARPPVRPLQHRARQAGRRQPEAGPRSRESDPQPRDRRPHRRDRPALRPDDRRRQPADDPRRLRALPATRELARDGVEARRAARAGADAGGARAGRSGDRELRRIPGAGDPDGHAVPPALGGSAARDAYCATHWAG